MKVVPTKTKTFFKEKVRQLLKEGYIWKGGSKKPCDHCWNVHRKKTCLCILEDKKFAYEDLDEVLEVYGESRIQLEMF